MEICATLATLGLSAFILTQLFTGTSIFGKKNYTYFTVDRRPGGDNDKTNNPRYKGIAYETKMYEDEKLGKTLGIVSYESAIYVTGSVGINFRAYIYNGSQKVEGIFKGSEIVPEATKLYARIPASKSTGNLVDLREAVPTAEYYIFMATESNFTGK
ncbi:MAG: hypothetical protein LBQ48_03330, partial [Oscillospiraceae bacterium]|nr:hypothetical protein [Oscillospiraceae bacterium]